MAAATMVPPPAPRPPPPKGTPPKPPTAHPPSASKRPPPPPPRPPPPQAAKRPAPPVPRPDDGCEVAARPTQRPRLLVPAELNDVDIYKKQKQVGQGTYGYVWFRRGQSLFLDYFMLMHRFPFPLSLKERLCWCSQENW